MNALTEHELRRDLKNHKAEIKKIKQSLTELLESKEGFIYFIKKDGLPVFAEVKTTDITYHSVSCYDIKTKEKYFVDREHFSETKEGVTSLFISYLSKEIADLDKKILELTTKKEGMLECIEMYYQLKKEMENEKLF